MKIKKNKFLSFLDNHEMRYKFLFDDDEED
jgi:hypothetical protein